MNATLPRKEFYASLGDRPRSDNVIRSVIISVLGAIWFLVCPVQAMAGNAASDATFAQDKLKHFAVSVFAAAGTSFVLHEHFESSTTVASRFGFVCTIGLGASKEVLDSALPDQTSSWKDLAADILGATVGALLFLGVSQ